MRAAYNIPYETNYPLIDVKLLVFLLISSSTKEKCPNIYILLYSKNRETLTNINEYE